MLFIEEAAMKRIGLLTVVGMVICCWLCLGATETLINGSGEDASGVILEFSERVRITSYDEDVFPDQEPRTRSDEITFSGGLLENRGRFRLSWTPSTATITDAEWMKQESGSHEGSEWSTVPMSAEVPEGGYTREELLDLRRAPTYEEIMSTIAEYPGDDEPLYVPAEDEAIWLTDLEGHADIYDNDSIRINYADWFDQGQITRIEVYRNGVKMEFLADMFDVVTNEQMKTFDGNPAENTPASAHTDHAIFGYEYTLRFYDHSRVITQELSTIIRSGVRYDPDYAYADIFTWWDLFQDMHQGAFTEDDVLDLFEELKPRGFDGVSIMVTYFMESRKSNGIYAMALPDPFMFPRTPCCCWTPSDEDLRQILGLVREAGLDAWVRAAVWVEGSYDDAELNWPGRADVQPASISAFFDNYTEMMSGLAGIAAEEGAEHFSPFTEMDSLYQYGQQMEHMLDRIDAVFGASLGIEQSTNHYLSGDSLYSESLQDPLSIFATSTFWDWRATTGEPLWIEMSCWDFEYDDSPDQSLAGCVERFFRYWRPAVQYYRTNYPSNPLLLGETGVRNYDGAVMSGQWYANAVASGELELDDQECADVWATILIGAQALGIDGLSAWNYLIWPESAHVWRYEPRNTVLQGTPADRIIRAIMGDGYTEEQ